MAEEEPPPPPGLRRGAVRGPALPPLPAAEVGAEAESCNPAARGRWGGKEEKREEGGAGAARPETGPRCRRRRCQREVRAGPHLVRPPAAASGRCARGGVRPAAGGAAAAPGPARSGAAGGQRVLPRGTTESPRGGGDSRSPRPEGTAVFLVTSELRRRSKWKSSRDASCTKPAERTPPTPTPLLPPPPPIKKKIYIYPPIEIYIQ